MGEWALSIGFSRVPAATEMLGLILVLKKAEILGADEDVHDTSENALEAVVSSIRERGEALVRSRSEPVTAVLSSWNPTPCRSHRAPRVIAQ
jgi:hypothetical protein